MVNHKNKISIDRNQELYKKYVFEKIKEIYGAYVGREIMRKDEPYYLVKDFLVTTILKMEHRRHVTFRLYGVDVLMYRPLFRLEDTVNHKKIGSIFFEFQDALLIIPTDCIG